MESGISRLDSYEDMFKEITRKLYGEDPDHRTSSVQNEFETSYKNDEDTGNGTDGSDDGNWTCEEEPLKGTDGSRIAAYHASKATWRCYECGDIMGGGPREAAEHFMELHSSRILTDESRHRHHSPRKDYLQADLKVDDIVTYLERLRERAERAAPPSRRTQETQTLPATLLPMTPTFMLQELPSTSQAQHLHQTTPPPSTSAPSITVATKRYNCKYCPYGTDRRDLFVRHENIHREQKPFYCYECNKPFNRADHVKKHFTRMHRDSTYDVSRIRKPSESKSMSQEPTETPGPSNSINGQQQQHVSYQTFASNREYQMQPTPGTSNGGAMVYPQAPTIQNMPNITSGISPPETSTSRRGQNSGCHSRSHTKSNSKNIGERRFSCQFCPWTGVDNWCLKRHLNTHIKPYSCSLCDYKAARSERLSTHLSRVHAKKQCTKCGFLCDTEEELHMHQLQTHRMSNTSASTSRTTPPTNRAPMQEPLHPPVGGRAPPGPPVFPPPQQPIVQPSSGSVVPSTSTLLGDNLMLRLFGIDVSDRTIHININVENSQNQERVSEQQGFHQIPNGLPFSTDMLHAALITRLHGQEQPRHVNDSERARRRKQLFPQRADLWEPEESDDEDYSWLFIPKSPNQSSGQSPSATEEGATTQQVKIQKNNVQSGNVSPRLFMCILCPRLTAGRGTIDEGHSSYQTQTSLLLHVNDRTEGISS